MALEVCRAAGSCQVICLWYVCLGLSQPDQAHWCRDRSILRLIAEHWIMTESSAKYFHQSLLCAVELPEQIDVNESNHRAAHIIQDVHLVHPVFRYC